MECFINARVYSYDRHTGSYDRHEGLVIDGPAIVSLNPADAGTGVSRIDLDGATVLPAFADCHVHITDTGYLLGERNFSGLRTYEEFAKAVAALPADGYVLAGNYDESAWSDGKSADSVPLESRIPDSYAMLVRIDGHSSIVNRKTLAWIDLPSGVQGVERNAAGEPTGKLSLEANWCAQSKFFAALPEQAKRAAERRATELAISRGALHLHVQLVGFQKDAYRAEIRALQELAQAKWYPKICEPDPALAKSLHLPYVGGDVFLDGSIGSCTAALSAPFLVSGDGTAPGSGSLKYTDEEVLTYFGKAEALGISAGVHAIGDRAIEQCISAWECVLGNVPSRNRHFIEHFEIARQDHIDRCARLGIYLSMQPQFDLLWGGSGNMYETRLGNTRMRTMNALGRAQRAGAILCGGDDSPVCELSPLLGMHAAVHHHEPSEGLTPAQALTMYTFNAARLGHVEEETGILDVGYAADLVVLDRDPLEDSNFAAAAVLQTWKDGDLVYER